MILAQLGLFALALAANTLSALAGGGAGLVQLPALLLLGLPFATALATHKIATVALGLGASIRHLRASHLRWPLALAMLAAGVPGVALGALLAPSLPEFWARLALGLLTCALGIYSIARPSLGQEVGAAPATAAAQAVGALGLFAIGVLNGSLTSGTGLFVTLWLVRWYGLDYGRATAYTLVLVGLIWNGAGALTLASQVAPRWDWLPALLLGSVAGGYLGAHLAVVKGNRLVKRAFESVTLAVGVSLLATAFQHY